MSDSADEIRQRMEHVRREVGDDVKGIVETAKTLSDWRYYVKHHPWMCVGAAMALGFLVVPRKKRYDSAEAKELVSLLKKYNIGVTSPPSSGHGLLRALLGMAAPVAARTFMNLAQQRFAGGGFEPYGRGPERPSTFEEFNVPR